MRRAHGDKQNGNKRANVAAALADCSQLRTDCKWRLFLFVCVFSGERLLKIRNLYFLFYKSTRFFSILWLSKQMILIYFVSDFCTHLSFSFASFPAIMTFTVKKHDFHTYTYFISFRPSERVTVRFVSVFVYMFRALLLFCDCVRFDVVFSHTPFHQDGSLYKYKMTGGGTGVATRVIWK